MTDPRTRLGLLLCVGILAVTLDRPVSLALLAAFTVLPLLALHLSAAWWRRGALAVLAITWSTVVSQGLFYGIEPRVALVHLGPVVVWREGVTYGLIQTLRMVAVMLAGIAVAISTPSDRLFAALLRLRVPFGLSFLAVTALRFVPEIGREIMVVRRARARRGRAAWKRAPWRWLALEVAMLRPVVARTIRRARVMAVSLDARGFDPMAPRAVRRTLVMSWYDVAILAGAALCALFAVTLRVLYLLYTSDTLYLPALRPLYGFARRWL